jgi:glycosyltransferase involved in cell wall biosynthesis
VDISDAVTTSKPALISVVIPMHNSEKWIPKTLLSVCAQDYANLEIVLIDDGSNDGSLEVVTKVSNEFPDVRIKIHSIKNSGVSYARNLGIQMADGELIALLDSDDVWDKTKLSRQYLYLNSHPDLIAVLCDFYISRPYNSNHDLRNVRLISNRSVKNMGMSWLSLEGNGGLLGSTALIWKDSFKDKVTFDSELSTTADLSFFLQLTRFGKVGHLAVPLVQYRQHDNQMHSNPDLLKREYPILIQKLEAFSFQINRRKINGNVLVMCGLLNLSRGDFRGAFGDFYWGVVSNPTSIINLPLTVMKKRLISYLTLIVEKRR